MVLSPTSVRALFAMRAAGSLVGDVSRELGVRFAAFVAKQCATKRGRRRFTLGVMVIGVLIMGLSMTFTAHAGSPAVCSSSGAPGPVDRTINAYDGSMTSWPSQVIGQLGGVFFAIFGAAALYAFVDGIQGAGSQPHLLAWSIAKTGLKFGAVSWAFWQSPVWGPGIINGIIQVIGNISGGSGGFGAGAWQSIEPGDVFMHGACIVANIAHSTDGWNFFADPIKTIYVGCIEAACSFSIIMCYAIVMLSIVLVRLEIPIVLAIGSILCLGFAAPELFMGFPMRYIGALVGLGAKIAAMALLVGVIENSSASWTATISNHGTEPTALIVIAGSVFCLAVATVFVPQIVGTIGGAPAMTLGSAIAAALSLNSVVSAAANMASKLAPPAGTTPKGGGGSGGGGGGGGGAGPTNTVSNGRPNANPLTAP